MKMFPGFPVLFPACSQSFPGESVRSRCSAFPAVTRMDAVPSMSNYIQQPGTLRTLGTGLKRNEFGLAALGTRLGTPGTNWQKGWGDAGDDWYGFYDQLGRCTRLPAPLVLGSGIRDFLHLASMIQIHSSRGHALSKRN